MCYAAMRIVGTLDYLCSNKLASKLSCARRTLNRRAVHELSHALP